MIKKTIILTAVLFIGYSAFLAYLAPKWWHALPYPLQDNISQAQNYLYDNNNIYKNVIVGSSLSAMLTLDSLPGMYNLSFAGQGIYDGLEIILHKDPLPETILLEENSVLTSGNKDFISDINSPLMYPLRGLFPALRAGKQPLAVIGIQMNMLTRGFLWIYRTVFSRINEQSIKSNKKKVFLKMLDLQAKKVSNVADEEIIATQFNNLTSYINIFKKKGVNLVFFEMPLDSSLTNQPTMKTIRESFPKYFPPSDYQYIPLPDSVSFETTDGFHLTRSASAKYTSYFKSKLNH